MSEQAVPGIEGVSELALRQPSGELEHYFQSNDWVVSGDGEKVYVVDYVQAIDLFDVLVEFWPYWFGVIAGLSLLLGLHILVRLKLTRKVFLEGVPFCKKCGYNLTGTSTQECPECGRRITRFSHATRARWRRRSWGIGAALVLIVPLAYFGLHLASSEDWLDKKDMKLWQDWDSVKTHDWMTDSAWNESIYKWLDHPGASLLFAVVRRDETDSWFSNFIISWGGRRVKYQHLVDVVVDCGRDAPSIQQEPGRHGMTARFSGRTVAWDTWKDQPIDRAYQAKLRDGGDRWEWERVGKGWERPLVATDPESGEVVARFDMTGTGERPQWWVTPDGDTLVVHSEAGPSEWPLRVLRFDIGDLVEE